MTDHHRLFLLAILTATIGGCHEATACMKVNPAATSCPGPKDVDKDALTGSCGARITSVVGDGDLVEGLDELGQPLTECCYPVRETRSTCVYGRPLRVGGAPVIASGDAGVSDWTADLAVRAAALSPGLRTALVERWTRAALDEHASVAAFSKIALDLLRCDAPPELVAAAHEAALDEIRHASHGFAIASAIAGAPLRPGRLPLAASLPLAADLAAVAAEAARDGCIGETVAALLAREAAERCDDPAIRAVLLGIAEDEERHAILGWRTVAWALRVGDADVRDAVAAVFAAAATDGVEVPLVGELDDTDALARAGLLDRKGARVAAAAALRSVILPAAAALLAARRPSTTADRDLHATTA